MRSASTSSLLKQHNPPPVLRQVIAALLGLSPEEHNALQRARADKMQRSSPFF
jgi:Ca2+/H+ antiporter